MASPILSRHNWLAGTLELSSKVRLGLTSRGVPRFRFVPYDKRFPSLAVGCSERNLFYNVHAIVEPSADGRSGTLIQSLGRPTQATEETVLLTTYAFDSKKELRQPPLPLSLTASLENHIPLDGVTFAIDPEGCRDVDDSVTFQKMHIGYRVAINIADVAAWIPPGSSLDRSAAQRATSFYSLHGVALSPMFHRAFSEEKASLLSDGNTRPTLSLLCEWTPGMKPTGLQFAETLTAVTVSYTYEQASQRFLEGHKPLHLLQQFVEDIGTKTPNPHIWIERLMLFYNTEVGKILQQNKSGILRRGAGPLQEREEQLQDLLERYPDLERTLFSSAEFCSASESETQHKGLGVDAYAYASSPLRRYVDLVNQRILKAILNSTDVPSVDQTLIDEMNRRAKQAKAFSRDLFSFTHLARPVELEPLSIPAIATLHNSEKNRLEVWVPVWNRSVKVRLPPGTEVPSKGTPLALRWYSDPGQARWKDKVVFQISC